MISPKHVQEFKELMKKEYGVEYTDAQAHEGATNLLGLFEVLYEVSKKDYFRKQKLKDSPKGFPIDDDGTYSCFICHESISTANGWYDKYGLKCLTCQRAVDRKIIPAIVFKNRKAWFTDWELQSKLNLHSSTIRKLVKENKIKPREVKTEDGRTHYRIYLFKENQEFLKSIKTQNEKEVTSK